MNNIAKAAIVLALGATAVFGVANASRSNDNNLETTIQSPTYFSPTATNSEQLRCYEVQPGDTLAKIANAFEMTYEELAKINNLQDPNLIYPGQKICASLEINKNSIISPPYIQIILSSVFSEGTRQWNTKINEWSRLYNIDPLLIAVIMEVESHGDKYAVSETGARGLFQVMPYHFGSDENPFDPDTNARVGLNDILKGCLRQSNNDFPPALACYNGGPMAAEWYLGNISRQDYVDFIEEALGEGRGLPKALQVEDYVKKGLTLLYSALEASLN
jgi:soluble lytic murein transglycosylase-like protein